MKWATTAALQYTTTVEVLDDVVNQSVTVIAEYTFILSFTQSFVKLTETAAILCRR